MFRKILKKLIAKFNAPILKELQSVSKKPDYLKQIEQAYKAGYNYHQKICSNNPEMIKWITQEDYFSDKQDNI